MVTVSRDIFDNQTIFASNEFTSIIGANIPFSKLRKIDNLCRSTKVTLTSASVYGNCGYVFNDFLKKFEVLDTDGETTKEVFRKAFINH